jgi:isocitrate/isopropylmalate dehydrogenase
VSQKTYKIAVLPGDGTGPEVVKEQLPKNLVLNWILQILILAAIDTWQQGRYCRNLHRKI